MKKTYYTGIIIALLFTQLIMAQAKNMNVNCGNQITENFNASKETHIIKIKLEAGDKLYFKVVPTGDYLNVRAEIWDPANGKIYPMDHSKEPMFINHDRMLEVTTGQLSASGTYTIKLFNHYKGYRKDERAGEYAFVTKCYKKDGRVIEN